VAGCFQCDNEVSILKEWMMSRLTRHFWKRDVLHEVIRRTTEYLADLTLGNCLRNLGSLVVF